MHARIGHSLFTLSKLCEDPILGHCKDMGIVLVEKAPNVYSEEKKREKKFRMYSTPIINLPEMLLRKPVTMNVAMMKNACSTSG